MKHSYPTILIITSNIEFDYQMDNEKNEKTVILNCTGQD